MDVLEKDTYLISLDERGMIIVEDEALLDLISGAAGAPAPSPPASGGGGTNFCGNNFCPGSGAGNVCPPAPPAPKPKPLSTSVNLG